MSSNKKKIMIIGLDGATWRIFDPVIAAGRMPNLKRLRDGGCRGVLRSTEPPVTPAAWSTMITGVNPGKHKVFSFERFDLKTNRLHFTNSNSIKCETMWSYLSRQGYKVASLNVPQTYPPYKVNGVIVSGYGCPGKKFDYTYPPELKERINTEIPDYDMALHWQKGDLNDNELFAANMDYCKRSFDAIYDLAQLAERDYGWDVMLAEIQQTDLMEHHIYKYLTPDGWEKDHAKGERVKNMLDHLDGVIGKLAGMAAGPDDLVIVASDHGLTAGIAKIKPNNLLRDWGYLKRLSPLKYTARRLKRNILRLLGKKMRSGRGSADIIEKLLLEPSKTKAFVAHTAQHAYIYLNVKDRQQGGIVTEGYEYDRIIEELKEKFLAVRDPQTDKPVFADAKTAVEMFGVDGETAQEAGDLVLVGAEGYLPIRSLRGESFIEPSTNDAGGTHSYDGMYLFNGGDVKPGSRIDADIADIAPTVYAALVVELPGNLDGKIIQGGFVEDLKSTTTDDNESKATPSEVGRMTAEEEQLISQRLTDLGYLE